LAWKLSTNDLKQTFNNTQTFTNNCKPAYLSIQEIQKKKASTALTYTNEWGKSEQQWQFQQSKIDPYINTYF
jgi:hypothetical protein